MAVDFSNPIGSVDSATIKCPSTYVFRLEDVSAADAGRTEDTVMDKMRIGQLVALELEWQNITVAECSAILQAFNPEYISVNYLDLRLGAYETSTFYVGNRSAPIYNGKMGIVSSVGFTIIERSGI